jgi:hypothetical protein
MQFVWMVFQAMVASSCLGQAESCFVEVRGEVACCSASVGPVGANCLQCGKHRGRG